MAEDVVYTAVVNVSTNAQETEQVVRDALEGMVAAAKQTQSALEATGGASGLLRNLQDLIGTIDNFKTAMDSVRASSAQEFSVNGATRIKTAYEQATAAVRSTLAAMAEGGQATSRPLTQLAQGLQNTLATNASQSSRQIIAAQRVAGATNLPNAGQLDTVFKNLQAVPLGLQKTFAPVEEAAKSLTAAVRDAASTNPDRQRAGLTALNQGLINKQETPGYPGLSNYPVIRPAPDRANFVTPSGAPFTYSPNGLRANPALPPVSADPEAVFAEAEAQNIQERLALIKEKQRQAAILSEASLYATNPDVAAAARADAAKLTASARVDTTTLAASDQNARAGVASGTLTGSAEYEAAMSVVADKTSEVGISQDRLKAAFIKQTELAGQATTTVSQQLLADASYARALNATTAAIAKAGAAADEVSAAETENAARASRVAQQLATNAPGTKSIGGGNTLSAAEGGIVAANGELVTSMEAVGAAARTAAPLLDRQALSQDKQSRSLSGSYFHGLTQGGWAGGGGDAGNPLGGLLETAGVLTKYALVGRSLQEVSRLARETFTDYANLDKAIAAYNQVIGGSDAANNSFINSLETISAKAGVSVVDALNAATKGVAAFSTSTTTAAQKQQIGQQFVGAATQNAVITGQPVGAAANDLIAIGTSFGIAASGLDQVNDAIATAHSLFGSSTLDISNGLKLLADDGVQAGYSMTELTQVVGLDAARLAESGDEVATNLQRVFAQFQSKAGQGALEGVGVDTSGNVKSQIEGLATVYDGLSTKQQQFILNTLGGAKAMKELVPLITDNTDLQNAFSKSLDNSGAGANLANAQLNSLAGQMKVIGETISNIGLDIARSGIFTPLLAAIDVLKPTLQLLDSLLQVWAGFPNPVKETAAAILEAVVALRLFASAKEKAVLAGGTGSISNVLGGALSRTGLGRLGRGGGAAIVGDGIDSASLKTGLNGYAEARAREVQASEAVATGSLSAADAEKVLAASATATSEALARLVAIANGATIGRTGNLIGGAADETATAVAAEDVLEDSSFQTTAATALAGTRIAGSSALAGDAGEVAAGGAVGEASLAGGGGAGALLSSPYVLGAIIAAVAAYSVVRDVSAVSKASNNANAGGDNAQAQTASNAPDTLAASADALRSQADSAKKAAGGLFGIANVLTGGEGRSAAAYADRQATVLSTEAQAKEKIQNTAGSTASGTGILDFSGVTALQTSITTLSANGFDAADTTRALSAALTGLASSTGLAIGKIGAQQAGIEARAGALTSLNTVSRQAGAERPGVGGGRGGQVPVLAAGRADPLGGGDTFLTRQLSGTVRGNISSAVGNVETSYIDNHPEMTPAQQLQLQQAADIQVKANLPDWDKLTKQEQNAILAGINTGVLSAVKTAKTANTINGAVDLQSLVAAANTATAGVGAIGTEAGDVAYSNSGDIAGATAKASLASLQQIYREVAANASKNGEDATDELNNLQQQIYTAEQAVDAAAVAHATALATFAESLVSPFDKAGQISVQLNAAVQALQSAKGADAQLAAQTALNTIAQQQLQQTAADIGASALDKAGYNTVTIDKAKQAGAQATLDAARSQYAAPGTPGYSQYTADDQGTKDALKAAQDAAVQTAQDTATQQSAVAAAQIDPRLVLALDSQTISGLVNQIKATPTDNLDALASLNTQLKAARVQQLQDSIAVSNAAVASSVFPGSDVEAAAAALTEALKTLSGDESGTAQWFTDYAAVKAAQIGVSQATLKAAQQAGNLSIDTTNPVAVAQKALSDAQGQLALDQKNGAPSDVTNTDKLNVSNANQAELSAQFTQNIGDATTAEQLGQISHQAYLTYLKTQQQQLREQQAGMVAGTQGYRQMTDELNTLGQDILAANNQLIGQFNIGDINVPTPYEVRRSLATQAVGQQYQTSNNVVINVNGTNYDDVVQLLGTYLGPVTTGQYTLSNRKVS